MVDITLAFMALQTISITVGVIYHIMTLRNQSRTRQAQLFTSIYNRLQDHSVQMNRIRYKWEWKNYDDFMGKYGPESNFEAFAALDSVGAYMEGIGVLVKEKLVDIRLVAILMKSTIMHFWEKLEPVVMELRKELDYPVASETEYLYRILMKYVDEHPELKT